MKSLASKVKSLTLKPASPRKCPVLGSRTTLVFDWLKMVKVLTNFVSSWRTPESLRKSFWRFFFSWKTLEFSGKFTKLWIEDLFFYWRSLPLVSLATRGSVLLCRGIFFCIIGFGLEPCVDSTSGDLKEGTSRTDWKASHFKYFCKRAPTVVLPHTTTDALNRTIMWARRPTLLDILGHKRRVPFLRTQRTPLMLDGEPGSSNHSVTNPTLLNSDALTNWATPPLAYFMFFCLNILMWRRVGLGTNRSE